MFSVSAKDPSQQLSEPEMIRTHLFLNNVYWEELEKQQVQPSIRPIHAKASSTVSVFISCHIKLALRLEVNEGL